jgi:hypothetical protein
MNTADRRAKLKEKDISGLTILLSREDRERLNRMTDLANGILCTKVSQASLIRRAIRVYEGHLESVLAKIAVAPGVDDLATFLREEKKDIFEANGIQPDGDDPAAEYQSRAGIEVAVLREQIKGMAVDQVKEFLKTGVKPTIQ